MSTLNHFYPRKIRCENFSSVSLILFWSRPLNKTSFSYYFWLNNLKKFSRQTTRSNIWFNLRRRAFSSCSNCINVLDFDAFYCLACKLFSEENSEQNDFFSPLWVNINIFRISKRFSKERMMKNLHQHQHSSKALMYNLSLFRRARESVIIIDLESSPVESAKVNELIGMFLFPDSQNDWRRWWAIACCRCYSKYNTDRVKNKRFEQTNFC